MLLPLGIRTHISCELTLYGGVCSGKRHAVHPGHHHQPQTNHRLFSLDYKGLDRSTSSLAWLLNLKGLQGWPTAQDSG